MNISCSFEKTHPSSPVKINNVKNNVTDDVNLTETGTKTEICQIPMRSCSRINDWLIIENNRGEPFYPKHRQNIELIGDNANQDNTITIHPFQNSGLIKQDTFIIGGYAVNGSDLLPFPLYFDGEDVYFKLQGIYTSQDTYSIFFDEDYQLCAMNTLFSADHYSDKKLRYLKYYHLSQEKILSSEFPSTQEKILLYIPFDASVLTKNNVETMAIFSSLSFPGTANFFGNTESDQRFHIFSSRQYDYKYNPEQTFSDGNYYHHLMRFRGDNNNFLCLDQCQKRKADSSDKILTQLQDLKSFSVEAWIHPEIPNNDTTDERYISFIHFGPRFSIIIKQATDNTLLMMVMLLTQRDEPILKPVEGLRVINNGWNHILVSFEFEDEGFGFRSISRIYMKNSALNKPDTNFEEIIGQVYPLNDQACEWPDASPCHILSIGNWVLNLAENVIDPESKWNFYKQVMIQEKYENFIPKFKAFNGAIEELMIFSEFRSDFYQQPKNISAQAQEVIACENNTQDN